MKKSMTGIIAALAVCLTMTGCGGSSGSSSETASTETGTKASVSTEASAEDTSGSNENDGRSHFKMPEGPITVSDSSGETIIKSVRYIATEGDGTVDLALTFHIDPDNNKAEKFTYKLLNESGSESETGTLQTNGNKKDGEITVRVKTLGLKSPENYEITIEDHQ